MILYEVGSGLYVNLTNRCTNNCEFCVRVQKDGYYGDLWLKNEPTLDDIINELAGFDLAKYTELVFCGYGEPTIRLDVLLDFAKHVKSISDITVRINTNGHANLIHGYDVTPKFEGLIDEVSISLNTADARSYQNLCHCEFGENAFGALIEFASLAKRYVKKVLLSVVRTTIPDEDIEKCQKIANDAGVVLKVREFIN